MRALLAALALASSAALAGTTSDPYTGSPIAIDGTPAATTVWDAANYDRGGEGIAFHNPNPGDCTPAKCSCTQVYRFGELPICGAPTFVTYTDNGMWAYYTIDVSSVGNYFVELLVAIGDPTLAAAGVSYHVRIDGKRYPDVGSYQLGGAPTADWNVFEWRGKSEPIPMVAGTHHMLVVVDQHWFNWRSIRMTFAKAIEWGWTWGPMWKEYVK